MLRNQAQTPVPPAPGTSRPQVVYVMGAGRSGSTILGITLGNCSEIFFAGELARWHRRAGRPLPGASTEDRERFWQEVRGDPAVGGDSLGPEVAVLQRSSAAFRPDRWLMQRRLRRRYRRSCEALFHAIARAAGARYIVDTSHFPRRARDLQALGGIDLYLVLLVRDPQHVVASYARKDVRQGPRFGTLATNAYLWLTHLLAVVVFLRHPRQRRLLVRHEEFLADPERVLRAILDCIGSTARVPDLNALRTGPAFLGNRLVNTEVVALNAGPSQETRASPSRLTAFLQLPWKAVLSRLGPVARNGSVIGR